MLEQALFCSSRLLSQQARGCVPREPVLPLNVLVVAARGRSLVEPPGCTIRGCQGDRLEAGSAGRQENSIEIWPGREGLMGSRGRPLCGAAHPLEADFKQVQKMGMRRTGLLVRHPQRQSRAPQGACQARRAGNKALRRGRLKCARTKPYR